MRVEFFAIEKSTPARALRMYGPIAQLVEQLAFNQWVAGSSPARLIIPRDSIIYIQPRRKIHPIFGLNSPYFIRPRLVKPTILNYLLRVNSVLRPSPQKPVGRKFESLTESLKSTSCRSPFCFQFCALWQFCVSLHLEGTSGGDIRHFPRG